MDEDNGDDELEIGEITERDSPDRITRPPDDELIKYDRGDKRNEISSSGGVIGERIGEDRDRLSKRFFGLYIVIAILCISTIFLYSGVNDLGNRIGELEKLLPLNSNGTVSLDKSEYHINDTATVTVVDTDRNINTRVRDKVNVFVRDTNTTEQISINLTETWLDTGEFTGTFTFAEETNITQNMMRVRINDTIEVVYEDEKTVENTPAPRIVNATIK